MAGYRNRTITHSFDELAEDGDNVYVTIRNPRTVPGEMLIPRPVALGPNGAPLDPAEGRAAGCELLAALITDMRVYDAAEAGDDQPLLALPATGDSVARMPLEIQNWLAEEVARAQNPTRTPDSRTS